MLRVARAVATVAVLAGLVLALPARRDDVRDQLGQLSPAAVAGALAYAVLALLAGLLAWRALLAELGTPLRVSTATRALFRGRPPAYARSGLDRDLGLPRPRAAGLVLDLVTLGVGLLVALATLPRLLPAGAPGWLHWSPVLVPLGLAGLTPPVLGRVCDAVLRVLRRPPLGARFSWTGVGTAALALLGLWLAYGLQITLLGWSLGADPSGLLLPAIGAFAAAWCAGYLVVIVPAGAGVREVVLTVALAAQLPGGAAAALTIAVVSRLLLTGADVLAALAGTALGRRRAPVPLAGPAADPPGTQPARSRK
jgi:uncharacterized membrane protein YbhN (UPF0104 family)